MQIILIGDMHLSGKNPVARLDDYTEVQFTKLVELVKIANHHDCPIVCVGDIFNVPVIANSILTNFGQILSELKHYMFYVWGNHDTMYHSLDMLDRTSLGMITSNNEKVVHISEFKDIYEIDWDYRDWNGEIIENGSDLYISHQAVVNKKMIGGETSWILDDKEFARVVDDSMKKYKLIFCGHWHKRYRFKYKDSVIINPGPVMRRTTKDVDEPVVQLIDLETKLRKIVRLNSVKSSIEVISDKHLESKNHKVKTDILGFVNALRDKDFKYSSSFLDNLMEVLDSHEIDDPIEKLIRKKIADLIEEKTIK